MSHMGHLDASEYAWQSEVMTPFLVAYAGQRGRVVLFRRLLSSSERRLHQNQGRESRLTLTCGWLNLLTRHSCTAVAPLSAIDEIISADRFVRHNADEAGLCQDATSHNPNQRTVADHPKF